MLLQSTQIFQPLVSEKDASIYQTTLSDQESEMQKEETEGYSVDHLAVSTSLNMPHILVSLLKHRRGSEK